MTKRFILAAGGTAGHLFPAEALARELLSRGATVELMTDKRGAGFGKSLPGVAVHHLAGTAVLGRGLIGKAKAGINLLAGTWQARRLLRKLKPNAVIGFGGYASVPAVMAAQCLKMPSAIHEQNAVMGRANRLLAKRAKIIALSFPKTVALPQGSDSRSRLTGNPVRPAVAAIGERPYRAPVAGETISLLIFGGSQGAKVFNQLVPAAIQALPAELRLRLKVVQQVRGREDEEAVASAYRQAGVPATLAPFFADLPERLAEASLVICRSGASSVMELARAGRPALLVPYPFAADDHQRANAKALAATGGAWVLPQEELTVEWLTQFLAERLTDEKGLAAAALAARTISQDDAARRLADLAWEVAA